MGLMHADSGYPDGVGGSTDISLNQLADQLVQRTIANVSFDHGDLVLTLDDGTTVDIRGNSSNDQSVTIAVWKA
ncbi:hypothetical protein WT83_27790 [Burkholderia territorii]|uniref:Uncharacterized protein n=1 Tax=Burkholderia territorii TaxID=1503055 RepID=A0A108E711_9BURK|nr:hypothetical protein [Burkholderia territorii]KWN05888.1 hypothetical protein WT83_27790 [Burkholderia territorii]